MVQNIYISHLNSKYLYTRNIFYFCCYCIRKASIYTKDSQRMKLTFISARGGELFNYIARQKKLTEVETRFIFLQLFYTIDVSFLLKSYFT